MGGEKLASWGRYVRMESEEPATTWNKFIPNEHKRAKNIFYGTSNLQKPRKKRHS